MREKEHFMDVGAPLEAPEKEYRAIPLPSQGARSAWLMAAIVLAVEVALWAARQRLSVAGAAFSAVLLLSALTISFGRWNEGRTRARVTAAGVSYRSGVRRADLQWGDVYSVRIWPARPLAGAGYGGWMVEVIGPGQRFRFATPARVLFRDEVRGESGIGEGEELARTIVARAGLRLATAGPRGREYRRGT